MIGHFDAVQVLKCLEQVKPEDKLAENEQIRTNNNILIQYQHVMHIYISIFSMVNLVILLYLAISCCGSVGVFCTTTYCGGGLLDLEGLAKAKGRGCRIM